MTWGRVTTPRTLPSVSPHSPGKPAFPRVGDTPPPLSWTSTQFPDQSISLLPPPQDPAFGKKGSEGLTPTQAIMMNNGLMWVFTRDSNAAFTEEFQALGTVNRGEGLNPRSPAQASSAQFNYLVPLSLHSVPGLGRMPGRRHSSV